MTIIEGGLETLDRVEAGEVEADEPLEFGVKRGEEKTEGVKGAGLDGTVGVADPKVVVLGDEYVGVAKLMTGGAGAETEDNAGGLGFGEERVKGAGPLDDVGVAFGTEGKPVVAIGMSRTTLARGV